MSVHSSRSVVRSLVHVSLAIVLVCAPFVGARPAVAAGDIIYVSVTSGSDASGNGSASQPFKSIERGLDAAEYGDTVRVAGGEYSVAASGESFPLWIPVGVRLQGCGMPLDTRVRGDGAHSVFRIDNGDSNTVLEGFVVIDGGGGSGGGVNITGGSSPGWGPTIRRNYFGLNEVLGAGGAIAITRGTAVECSPLVENNLFVTNRAAFGGAVFAAQAVLDLRQNVMIVNHATDGMGGGIYAFECSGDIRRASLSACTAGTGSGGGIAFEDCGNVAVRTADISACQAQIGAGIYAVDTTQLWVDNAVLSKNEAVSGGGAFSANTSCVYFQCTFEGNTGSTVADGIRAVGTGGLMVSDSILWNNHGDDVESLVSTTIRYSCTREATLGGTGVIHWDPAFRDAASADVRLRVGSPCIDAGDPAVTMGWDYDDIARPQDGDGDGSARPDMGAFEYWLDVQRDAGDDRYATAAAMWGDRMPFTHHAVLATGYNFPDALCAAGLAGLYGAPILLTRPDHLPAEVVTELEARNIYEVFIVGGADVVGASVVSELNAMDIDVIRLAGVDRYETACAVADFIADKFASGGDSYCLVARGDMFPDALSVAPIAWNRHVPVLLVRPTSVPEVTRKTLMANLYDEAIIAGDVTAVSPGVASIVDSYVGGVTRLGGDTRYETSAVIAGWALGQGWLDAVFFGLATGENFPDALAGGAVCGYEDGPLLLTPPDSLNSAARALMFTQQDVLREICLFGGADVLSDQVMSDCAALMP